MPHSSIPRPPRAGRSPLRFVVLALLVLAASAAAQDVRREDGERRLDRFRAYLDRAPHHPRAFEGLVEAARAAGAVEELLADYRARLARDPDDGAARTVLARLLGAENRAPEALALLRGRPHVDPREDLMVARLERDVGRLDAALDAVRRARDRVSGEGADDPELADILIDEEAELHLLRGDSGAAARTFLALADARPDDPDRALDVAERLHAAGLRTDALRAYARAEELLADDPERRARALAAQGALLEELADGRGALQVYGRTLPLLAADHWLRRDLLDRMLELHRRAGTLGRAASELRSALRDAPGDLGVRLALVRALELDRRGDQALQELRRAVELAPRDVELARRHAAALLADGRREEHAAALQRALELAPRDRDLRFDLGLTLARLGNFAGAAREWNRLRALAPDDAALVRRIAFAWDDLGEPARARRAFEAAIEAAPHEARWSVDLARYLGDAGDRAGARAVLAAAEEAAGERPDELALIAEALVEHGRDPAAAAALGSRIVALAPADTTALRRLADLEVELDRVPAARRHLRRWIEVAGEIPGRGRVAADWAELVPPGERSAALESLAREAARHGAAMTPSLLGAALAERLGHEPLARELLTRAVAHRPDDAALRAHLADRLRAWGETDAALGQLDILIERDPAMASVYLLDRIALGLRSEHHRHLVATDLARLRALLPGGASTWRDAAAAYRRLGESSDAVACLEQALRIDPEDADAQLQLGRLQADLGRRDEAYASFQAAWRHGEADARGAAITALSRLLGDRRGLQSELRRLRRLTLRDPFDTETPRMLAQLALRGGDPSGASLVLSDLLRREGDRGDLLRLRAEASHALRRTSSARADLVRLDELGEPVDELALGFARDHLEEDRVTQAVQVALVAQDPLPFVAELVARDEGRAAMTLLRGIERRSRGTSRSLLLARARVHEALGEGFLALRALESIERAEGADWPLARRMGALALRLGDTRRFDAEGERMIELDAPPARVTGYFEDADRRAALTRIRSRRVFDARRDAAALEEVLGRMLVDGRDATAMLAVLDRLLARARHPAERPPGRSRLAHEAVIRAWRLECLLRFPAYADERRAELARRLARLDEPAWIEFLHLEREDLGRVPEAGPVPRAARIDRARTAIEHGRERFPRSVGSRASCARLALAVGDPVAAERELAALVEVLEASGPAAPEVAPELPDGDGRALEPLPDAETATLLLARVVARRGDLERARTLLEPAAAEDRVGRLLRLALRLEIEPRATDVRELVAALREEWPPLDDGAGSEAARARLARAAAAVPLAFLRGAARRAAAVTACPPGGHGDLTAPDASPARGSR